MQDPSHLILGEYKKLIGLTGPYCAGKNRVARLLEARGLQVLDVDLLGHKAIETQKEIILARFGPGLLKQDGTIDRRALGQRVFGQEEELKALEAIIHPEANRLTEVWIREQEGPYLVINAALLHHASVIGKINFILLVHAPWFTRLLRARKRDGLSLPAILKRFKSQNQFKAQYLEKRTDIYMVNNPGFFHICETFYLKRLERRIDTILAREGMVR